MKKILLACAVFATCWISGQKTYTNGELLRKLYPNCDEILNMPDVEFNPKPVFNSVYKKTLGEMVKEKNKYTYTSKMKKEILLKRINRFFSNSNVFDEKKVLDNGEYSFVFTADVNSKLSIPFGSRFYNNRALNSKLKIKVKDYAYQIEVVDFDCKIDDVFIARSWQYFFSEQSIDFFKKINKIEWNYIFTYYDMVFSDANKVINETNDF